MLHLPCVPLTSTKTAVSLRTKGKATSKLGKATSHDTAQALSHSCQKLGTPPTPLKVLINDTMQVINTDSRKGMTRLA